MTAQLRARPATLKQANSMVGQLHRHHKPVRGHRFSIAAYRGDDLVGVVVVGRPVARMVDQYTIAEVTRLCTDGSKNVCSFLLARAARAAGAMGFDSIQTYTLETEGGGAMRASGWECEGVTRPDGEGWNNRPGRRDDQPTCAKTRWRKRLNNGHKVPFDGSTSKT